MKKEIENYIYLDEITNVIENLTEENKNLTKRTKKLEKKINNLEFFVYSVILLGVIINLLRFWK